MDYVILNVSNTRPLHLSTWLSSKLLEDPENMDADVELNGLITQLYGEEMLQMIRPALDEYYDCIGDLGKEELKVNCKRAEFFYHEYGALPYAEFTVSDGVLRTTVLKHNDYCEGYLQSPEHLMAVLRDSEVKYAALYEKLEKLEAQLPEDKKHYFRCFLKHQTFYMLHLTRWTMAFGNLLFDMTDDPKAVMETGVACRNAILEDRKVLEQGHWAGWHNGERKVGILAMRDKIQELYGKKYG